LFVGSTAELAKLLKNQDLKNQWFFLKINTLIYKVRSYWEKYHF
jgi:hypothetical protein